LPLSYAVDGLRGLVYGGLSSLAWHDVLILFGWLLVAPLLTALAARRRRHWTIRRIKPEQSLQFTWVLGWVPQRTPPEVLRVFSTNLRW
jgi:hypothetical protein